MIRGTSVPLALKIAGNKLSGATNVIAIIRQGSVYIEKSVTPVYQNNYTHISVPLTISETMSFENGIAEVQVMWTNSLGLRDATMVAEVDILKVLKET